MSASLSSGHGSFLCPICNEKLDIDLDECTRCRTRFDVPPLTLPAEENLPSRLNKILHIGDFFNLLPGKKKENSNGGDEPLVNFNTIEKKYKLLHRQYLGVKPIPLDKIIGSLGRYKDFNQQFLPSSGFSTARLKPIIEIIQSGKQLPPVTVYEISGHYFIIDGHHRVSAYFLLGEKEFIDAEITKMEIDSPLKEGGSGSGNSTEDEKNETLKNFIISIEQKSFQKQTYLFNNILIFPILVTHISSYAKLFEDITAHYQLSVSSDTPANFVASALEWYRLRFLPVISIINKYKLLSGIPDRTAADMYVWLRMHRAYLSAQTSQNITIDSTIADFLAIKNKKTILDDIPEQYDKYINYILTHRNT